MTPSDARTRLSASALSALVAAGIGAPALGQNDPDLILPPSVEVEDPPEASRSDDPANGDAGPVVLEPGPRVAPAPGVVGDDAAAGPTAEDRRSVAATLAEPERGIPMEEVIVVNESEWRLPDLGSEWRRAQAETEDDGRIVLTLLPLYDPESRGPVQDLFERNSELHRVGMIEVVRLRFGGRPQD